MFQLQLFFCSIVTNGTALQLCRDTRLSQELHYCSQVKLATGTLTLQEHKAKFARKGEVSSLCPICKQETENTAHFILQCASLQEVRKPFMDKILSYLETNENLTPYVTDLLEDQNMLQLLIDCTKFNFVPLKERSYLETLSRQMRSRLKIIGKLNFKQNCYF